MEGGLSSCFLDSEFFFLRCRRNQLLSNFTSAFLNKFIFPRNAAVFGNDGEYEPSVAHRFSFAAIVTNELFHRFVNDVLLNLQVFGLARQGFAFLFEFQVFFDEGLGHPRVFFYLREGIGALLFPGHCGTFGG